MFWLITEYNTLSRREGGVEEKWIRYYISSETGSNRLTFNFMQKETDTEKRNILYDFTSFVYFSKEFDSW